MKKFYFEKNNIRILSLILAIMMLCSLLSACTEEGSADSTTEEGTTEEAATTSGIPEGYSFELTQDYTVIRSVKAGANAKSASIELKNRLSELFGGEVAISEDWKEPEDGALEILIGSTNREGSTQALAAIGDEIRYSVSIKDKSIVIAASSDAIIPYAVDYFLSVIYHNAENSRLYLPAELDFTSEAFSTLAIAEGGKARYGIVYSQHVTDLTKAEYVKLQSGINTILGNKTQNIKNDALSKAGKYSPTSLEILLGVTGHPENAEGRALYDYDECGFCVVGSKIIITGRTLNSTFYAAERFLDLLKASVSEAADGTKQILLPYYEPVVWKYEGYGYEIPEVGATLTEAYDCGDDAVTMLYADAKRGDAESYIEKALAAGFEKVASSEFGSELHVTLESKSAATRLFVGATADGMRLTAESLNSRAFPQTVEADPYKAPLSITQTALNYAQTSGSTNGMSYILQLTDGSFVIWDGGWATDAAELYQHLKRNAPQGSVPHIRMWIFTHLHGDHSNCFLEFGEEYGGAVKLDYVGINIPNIYSDNEGTSIYTSGKLAKAANQLKTQIVKLHTGTVLHLPGADIEILLTHEDLGVNNIVSTYRNDQSLVTRIIAKSDKVLLPGDAQTIAGDYIVARYGGYLKSNYVQVAHHGSINHPTCLDFYKVSAPTYVLFPGAQSRFNENKKTPENAYLLNLVGIKNFFVADGADKTIELD